MRIAFMGTPDFAVPTLERLASDGHDVAAAYTQPPRPAGRGKTLKPTPVQLRAQALGIPVRSPASLREEAEQQAFLALDLDAAVVAAYGLILPKPILDAPRLGCLNVHASLLPRWRGAAPIHRAILAGDVETGVTIMDMERGLDTGPMRLIRKVAIADKTGGGLTAELAAIGAQAMAEVLASAENFPPIQQPADGATYAAKIQKHEARLDFSEDAVDVERRIRAFAPAPGAFFEHAGERIRVLAAELSTKEGSVGSILDDDFTIACQRGSIRAIRVQRTGRGIMSAADLMRGFPVPAGTQLG